MSELPKILDKRLEELREYIKPVERFSRLTDENKLERDNDGVLYFIEDVDPRSETFTIKPKPTQRAEEVNPIPYKLIKTVHRYGAPVFFKPSVAEVLAQITDDDTRRCIAFETVHLGFTDDSSYHTGLTKLYERLQKSS